MDYGRTWRIAKNPVILLTLLVLVLLAGYWGYSAVTAPLPPAHVDPCVATPVTDGKLRADMVSVRVLNASNKRGKASEVSQQLKRQGFKVVRVGNADENQEKSVIIGGSADSPEVALVHAQFNGFETLGDGRPDRSVEVRIGQNYDSMIADAPTDLAINATSICLPAPPAA